MLVLPPHAPICHDSQVTSRKYKTLACSPPKFFSSSSPRSHHDRQREKDLEVPAMLSQSLHQRIMGEHHDGTSHVFPWIQILPSSESSLHEVTTAKRHFNDDGICVLMLEKQNEKRPYTTYTEHSHASCPRLNVRLVLANRASHSQFWKHARFART
jgi:hypothetical protein